MPRMTLESVPVSSFVAILLLRTHLSDFQGGDNVEPTGDPVCAHEGEGNKAGKL